MRLGARGTVVGAGWVALAPAMANSLSLPGLGGPKVTTAPMPAYAYSPSVHGNPAPPPAASGNYPSAEGDYGDYPPAEGDYPPAGAEEGDYPPDGS